MRLSEDIFSYGMGQLPVATSSIVPPEPFRSWGKRATQLEAELDDERDLRYKIQNETSKRIYELESENEALHAFANAITMDVTSKIIELQEKLDDALKESNND